MTANDNADTNTRAYLKKWQRRQQTDPYVLRVVCVIAVAALLMLPIWVRAF